MENHNILTRVKVLRLYIKAADTRLSGMKMIQDKFMGHPGVDVLGPRLQKLKKDHQSLTERFNAFCNESGVSRGTVHDTSERLLSLQREQEFLKDRCFDLMIEFFKAAFSVFIKEKQSEANATATGQEEREAVSRVAGYHDLVFDTNIEELKQIMSYFMLKDEASVIEDVEDPNGNKRLIDWIKDCGESDKDWEVVKAIKDRAIEVGAQLSRLLVDVMIMMSESVQVLEMFRIFISSLEYCGGEKPIVINKFVYLLRMTVREIKKKKYSGGSSSDVSEDKKTLMDQNKLEELFDKFLNEIIHLEMILKDHGVPDSKIWKDKALSTLKAGLQQYEEDFKAVELQVTELRVLYSFIHESNDVDESLRREMGLKIDELWTQLEEPKEEQPQGSRNV